MAQEAFLDWKLDIINPTYAKEYEAQFLRFLTLETRLTLAVIIAFGTPLVVGMETWINHLSYTDFTFWKSEYLATLWVMIWCALFFWKRIYQNAIFFASIAFCGISYIVDITCWVDPRDYIYIEVGDMLSPSIFIILVGLQLRNFYVVVLLAMLVVLHTIEIMVTKHDDPWQYQFGWSLPNFANFAIALYCAYYLEKRMKYDFLRKKLLDFEAQKLKWMVAQDASLLRNIFPKNLSDELELLISQRKQPAFPLSYAKSVKSVSFKVSPRLSPRLTPRIEKPDPVDEILPNAAESPLSKSPRKVISRTRFSDLKVTIPQLDVSGEKTPVFSIPPVIYTPNSATSSTGSSAPPTTELPALTPSIRYLTSSGNPLHTGHEPELHTFLSGAKHSDGSAIDLSHSYSNVVVVFSDVVGFTNMSSCISPQELVQLLNKMFSMFDDIMDTHKLEKIRTVGDAYLCVANMSIPLENPEEEAVLAALKMVSAVSQIKGNLSLRVGIASGPLIAGVTGNTKWNYDIFGKPFADACLMEVSSMPNTISISDSVYQGCKNNPNFRFQQLNVQAGADLVERYIIQNKLEGDMSDAYVARLESNGALSILIEQDFPSNENIEGFKDIVLDKSHSEATVSESEITLTEFPVDQTLDFTTEDLDLEEQRVRTAKINTMFKFKTPTFEKKFWDGITQKTYDYTTGHLIFLTFCTLMLLISDLCLVTDHANYKGTWATYTMIISVLVGFLVYRHFYGTHRYSHAVASVVLFLFNLGFIVISILSPTDMHYFYIGLCIVYTSSFACVQGLVITMIEVVTACTSAILCFTVKNGVPYPFRHYTSMMILLGLTLVIQYFMVRSFRTEFLTQKRVKLDTHHQKIMQHRAKMLLSNILPDEIIPRLKPSLGESQEVSCVVDLFQDATMMFVNITNLEELTAELAPEKAFQVYNEIYTLFDEATKSFGLEKIKTINNVYMVASGLPKKIGDHALVAVNLAKELYHIVNQYSFPLLKSKLRIRVGIASGPVVAGIIGKKKYAYDCWSDTVNTAARMESNGWNSYAQLSPAAYEFVRGQFDFHKRLNVPIKGKGNMDTYMLKLSRAR